LELQDLKDYRIAVVTKALDKPEIRIFKLSKNKKHWETETEKLFIREKLGAILKLK